MNKSVTAAATTELIKPGSNVRVHSISLAKVHATDSVSVNLYKSFFNTQFYIIKNLVIPKGVTLVLDSDNVKISSGRTEENGVGLYIKLSAADSAVDVIINKVNQ